MEFRILGPLEVVRDGVPVPLAGLRQRALLAVLLLHAREVVSVDRLIDELWGDSPPATAAHTIQVYISNLRKTVDAGASREDGRLLTRPPGYLLRVGPDELDLDRFERLGREGRDALAAGDHARAAQLLREALALWRGPALADLAYEDFAQAAVARLEELRVATLEDRIEADIALGHHTAAVPELEAICAAYPLRERPRGQLMLALYRGGRQAEALEVFQAGRRALVDELGIDPSRELARLERLILQHDPELDLAARTPATASAATPGLAPPSRSILLVADDDATLDALVAQAVPLARSQQRHDLILARALARGGPLGDASAALSARREALAGDGIGARAAAFTSREPGRDLTRLASEQDVDLVLAALAPAQLGELPDALSELLADAPCDVALALVDGRAGVANAPVLVPFGGAEHDWAALELGAWLAGAHGVPLRLLGAETDEADASPLLAHAALAVQGLTGVATEPVLVAPGPEGVIAQTTSASLLVAGVPEDWRAGITGTRARAALDSAAPVLLVRRGLRPGGLAPRESLTRFTWSLGG